MSNTTKVKICGITNLEDARFAASAGADYLGYILYPKSARYVSPETIRSITEVIQSDFPRVRHVGVFVDEPLDTVIDIVTVTGLNYAQLHGQESPKFARDLSAAGI